MRDEEDRWSILCRDGAGRARDLVVFVTEGADIALQAPPGEVAVIGPNQVSDVKYALSEAQIRAMARAELWPLQRWAQTRLRGRSTVVRLDAPAVAGMAELCGMSTADLLSALSGDEP